MPVDSMGYKLLPFTDSDGVEWMPKYVVVPVRCSFCRSVVEDQPVFQSEDGEIECLRCAT